MYYPNTKKLDIKTFELLSTIIVEKNEKMWLYNNNTLKSLDFYDKCLDLLKNNINCISFFAGFNYFSNNYHV